MCKLQRGIRRVKCLTCVSDECKRLQKHWHKKRRHGGGGTFYIYIYMYVRKTQSKPDDNDIKKEYLRNLCRRKCVRRETFQNAKLLVARLTICRLAIVASLYRIFGVGGHNQF